MATTAKRVVTAGGPLNDLLQLGVSGETVAFGSTGSITAAGSAQTDAATLTNTLNYVTAASVDGTKGVILPSTTGAFVAVYNMHASNGLKIYPHSGGDINDGTQNAAVTIEGKTLALFVNLDGTTYAAIYTANT